MPVDRRIVHDAAAWLVKLHGDEMTAREHVRLAQWCGQSPEHERAWQAANELARTFGAVPTDIGQATLGRQRDRRAALKVLAAVALVSPLAWHYSQRAAYRTATGEQASFILDDGSVLTLNTASAADVVFDGQQRLVILREGEMLIETASDARARPFRVRTAQGSLRALGTRFAVRQYAGRTELAVLAHAVEVRASAVARPVVVPAGFHASFSARAIGAAQRSGAAQTAWQRGLLLADKMRLDDFLLELARYRRGILRCDPAVAGLRISGIFRTDNIDQALDVLQQTLPVAILSRTPYWLTVVAAPAS
ncbi:FecR domain-containing protein [Janthinobacterium sp. YR213]|uniref:FecR domain-containing protein n=1 Tax=Janthinobacterium sp. YR213 TaxID=1881027 RepID=UPI001B8BF33A|nr:FecR domain-containing protein [Janthinobacterium sp. YR213]